MDIAIVETDREPEQLASRLDQYWRQLKTDDRFRAKAAAAGVDLAALDAQDACPYSAESAAQGNRGDVATAILIGVSVAVISDVAKHSLRLLWDKVLKEEVALWFGPVSDPEPAPRREPTPALGARPDDPAS